jgi:hypothetical protein
MTARPLMVRSKNAGPFTLTIDVIFNEPEDAAAFYAEFTSGDASPELGPVSAPGAQFFLDRRAAAVKITTGRLIPAGSFGDLDLYGCQQHVGVMEFMGLLGRSDIASPLR